MLKLVRLFSVATALLAFASARADLYGLTTGGSGTVYTLDPATGAATAVVDLHPNTLPNYVDLDFLGDTLYVSDIFTPQGFSFGTVDLATGLFTRINDQGGSSNWHGLAANQAANLLYADDIDGSTGDLKTVTPSGTVTQIGPSNLDIRGLAYDDTHSVLYGVTVDTLYTLDTATGAATLVGALGLANFNIDIAYDEATGLLYLNVGEDGDQEDNLFTVDKTTGAASLVGPNGPVNGVGIDGLAYRPVPEPATIAALALGTLAFLHRRRTRG